MAQICSLLVAEMKYKFLGTLAGNPPLLYLRRVVMVYQDSYHSWKHFKIHLSRKFPEMYDSHFHFYFMTHQWNTDPTTINPLLVYGLFKARAWSLIKTRLLCQKRKNKSSSSIQEPNRMHALTHPGLWRAYPYHLETEINAIILHHFTLFIFTSRDGCCILIICYLQIGRFKRTEKCALVVLLYSAHNKVKKEYMLINASMITKWTIGHHNNY